jgi:hypothetical protein
VADVKRPTVGRYTWGVIGAVRFLWSATRGSRLRPWRSPYLRWRTETYTGMHAETIDAKAMISFVWRERRQFLRFLQWTDEMRIEAKSPHA